MGNACSCVCAQPAETKFQVDVARKENNLKKAAESVRPIRTRKKKKKKMTLQELPPELIIPSLARTYLTKRHLEAARMLKNFSLRHRLLYSPLITRPEIIEIEKTLPQFFVKNITSNNLKFIPSVELAEGGYYEGQ